jgi:hypothetical protein
MQRLAQSQMRLRSSGASISAAGADLRLQPLHPLLPSRFWPSATKHRAVMRA